MTAPRTGALLFALALGLAQAAAAQQEAKSEPLQAAPARPGEALRPVRLGASHRVDVIAPGERVETVLDRLRASRQQLPAAGTKPVERLPVRGPDGKARSGEGHGGPDQGHGPGSGSGSGPPMPSSGGPPANRPR